MTEQGSVMMMDRFDKNLVIAEAMLSDFSTLRM